MIDDGLMNGQAGYLAHAALLLLGLGLAIMTSLFGHRMRTPFSS